MNGVDRRMNNQAIGLLPLLLFCLLDNHFSYLFSFIASVGLCIISLISYRILTKDRIYQFMLIPASATFSLYSIFLLLRIEPVLFTYSPLIMELFFVAVLAIIGFFKRSLLRKIRHSYYPTYKRTLIRTTLNEFYFLVQLVQGLYTLHLFIVLFYTILPDPMKSVGLERFIFRYMAIIIGVIIIVYEQIRLTMMHGSLKKEMWLPVLNDSGKVIGCIARSVARSLPRKYYHPIVRIAVVYDGMLYLTKRSKEEYVSPDTLDYPFSKYVLFRQTVDNTAKAALAGLIDDKDLTPRFMVRYTFENEKVKHLVSLFVVSLHSQDQLNKIKKRSGKLWTQKQIEENLDKKLFSDYFEKEYSYLKNTILFAEQITKEAQKPADEDSANTVV